MLATLALGSRQRMILINLLLLGNFLSASFSVQVGGGEAGEGAHHDGQPVRGLQPRPRHPLLQRQRDLRQHSLQQARRIIRREKPFMLLKGYGTFILNILLK